MADLTRLDGTPLRRARHVVSDSARAVQLATLLASQGDLCCHRSPAARGACLATRRLRDQPARDGRPRHAVHDAIGPEGGARMTGGGFGGCVVVPCCRTPACPPCKPP